MEDDKRIAHALNDAANEITEADIEALCDRVARETAYIGSLPHLVIEQLAEAHLRGDLARKREEMEHRQEEEIGRVDPDYLPALVREQKRERERLEYRLSLQVRDLAGELEDIYWSQRLRDRPDAVQNIPEATGRLQDRLRAEEAMLARQHERDLEWLHSEPNVRLMLTWISRLSPRAVDAALADLRHLQHRELEVLKARHEHEIRVKALALEHEQDRAFAYGSPSPGARPENAGPTKERPRRMRKPDLDFER